MVSHGDDGVIAAGTFALVRPLKLGSSRRGGQSPPWAMELILFAVDRKFEGQGVAKRLQRELFRFCNREAIPKMVVLSAELVGQQRNWWCKVGGLDPDADDDCCEAFTNFAALQSYLATERG